MGWGRVELAGVASAMLPEGLGGHDREEPPAWWRGHARWKSHCGRSGYVGVSRPAASAVSHGEPSAVSDGGESPDSHPISTRSSLGDDDEDLNKRKIETLARLAELEA